MRQLLVESAQSYTRGKVGHKSIAYADKANERLRQRFYRMTLKNGTKRTVATTAIVRELACFVWMTASALHLT